MAGIWFCTGDRLDTSDGINNEYSYMDSVMFLFPIEETNLTIRRTNTRFKSKGSNKSDKREFFKFLGVMILVTRFKFTISENL